MPKSYPENEPAWVEDPERPGKWSLRWLDADGHPAEGIGVDRECDVPGIHTPGALAALHKMPIGKQSARIWNEIPAAAKGSEA